MTSDSSKWFYLAFALTLGWLLWLLAPILTPFAISALLAYMGDPLADWLESKGFTRTLAVSVVFLLMTIAVLAIVLLLIPVLEQQISALVSRLPGILAWAQTHLAGLLTEYGFEELGGMDGVAGMVDVLKSHWQKAGGIIQQILGSFSHSSMLLVNWIMNLVLIPVVTFYLLRDWDMLVEKVHNLLPRHIESVIGALAKEADEVLGAFVRGQVSVMAVLGMVYTLGLWIIGVDFAFLIGMGAGAISFIPYLGTILGVGIAVIAAWFQFHDVTQILIVLGVFGLGQLLQDMVLVPRLVGDRIGLHPVAVLFSIMAGGQLFGFLGILLALPVASVVVILLRHFKEIYQNSSLYQSAELTEACLDSNTAKPDPDHPNDEASERSNPTPVAQDE